MGPDGDEAFFFCARCTHYASQRVAKLRDVCKGRTCSERYSNLMAKGIHPKSSACLHHPYIMIERKLCGAALERDTCCIADAGSQQGEQRHQFVVDAGGDVLTTPVADAEFGHMSSTDAAVARLLELEALARAAGDVQWDAKSDDAAEDDLPWCGTIDGTSSPVVWPVGVDWPVVMVGGVLWAGLRLAL